MEYKITRATLDDAEEMIEIENICFKYPWPAFAFMAELMFDDSLFYALREESGKMIGFCGLRIIAGEGNIMNICVHPEYRKRGLGEALLTFLMQEGRNEGADSYTLEVRVSNEAAIALYEKLGFVSEGRRKKYYDDGEDAYIMWKRD